eukprot:8718641-Ditylum_brightwellii.AAC.1
MTAALETLVDATNHDCTAVKNLLTSNTDLTQHVANLNAQVKTKDSELEVMCLSINDLTAALQALKNETDTSAGVGDTTEEGKFYCWIHGISTGEWHMSANCKRPKADHKKTDTFYNRMKVGNKKIIARYRR